MAFREKTGVCSYEKISFAFRMLFLHPDEIRVHMKGAFTCFFWCELSEIRESKTCNFHKWNKTRPKKLQSIK